MTKNISARVVGVFTLSLLASLATATLAAAESYDEWNFAELQKKYHKVVADPVPWVGFWWPYSMNGIATGAFDVDRESPAEKLDRALGNRNWVAGWEWANHGYGRAAADWWGHCNGWATAAIMEHEPRDSKRVGNVTFEVHDRKALLSEYWMESGQDFIGTRVWNSGDFSSWDFWDVTPAQFHLVMTNIVGRQQRSVIIDRFTGYEVWNQPIVAYEIQPTLPEDYLGTHPRYRNVHRVNVKTTIWWAIDEVEAAMLTPKFDWKQNDAFEKRTLRYELWLDAAPEFDSSGRLKRSGDIVLTSSGTGGQWKNGSSYAVLLHSHPDFIWIPLSYASSSGQKNPRLYDSWVKKNIAPK